MYLHEEYWYEKEWCPILPEQEKNGRYFRQFYLRQGLNKEEGLN